MADEDEDLWPLFHPSRRRPGRDRGRTPPGRVRSLSRDEIVRTAIKVADAEGPHAISMRRIARELNAGAMSLYWHVSSKEELLDLMLDAIHGELTETEITGDVRADLHTLAVRQRAMLGRHRWVMPFMGGRPPMGPKSLRNVERSLGVFTGQNVPAAIAMTMLMSVLTYVMGAVGREQQEERSHQDRERAQEESGTSPAELHDMYFEFMNRVMQSGRYPNFTEMIKQGVDPDDPGTMDERFEFGLDCLLDGIMVRLKPSPGNE